MCIVIANNSYGDVMQIASAIVVVTGGGSGLGAATLRHFAMLGARIVALDINHAAAEAVAKPLGGLGLGVDVSDADQVEQAFATVQDHFGGCARVVVNCAGIGTAERILPRDGALTVAGFARTLKVNLLGTYTVLNVAARAMAEAAPLDDADGARGVIINTASVAYQDGQIGQAAYAASKGGIAALTLPAARELARFGIRVMTIAPGLFETSMSAGLPDDIRAALTANVPFPSRMGDPAEYALLAAHIVENQMLNGTVIRLDGGVRMPPR
jgi:NAD(P)-dependent dehydrogenase (short-subunit alcohol dehydrogenase family)